jgi:hypothetical protein
VEDCCELMSASDMAKYQFLPLIFSDFIRHQNGIVFTEIIGVNGFLYGAVLWFLVEEFSVELGDERTFLTFVLFSCHFKTNDINSYVCDFSRNGASNLRDYFVNCNFFSCENRIAPGLTSERRFEGINYIFLFVNLMFVLLFLGSEYFRDVPLARRTLRLRQPVAEIPKRVELKRCLNAYVGPPKKKVVMHRFGPLKYKNFVVKSDITQSERGLLWTMQTVLRLQQLIKQFESISDSIIIFFKNGFFIFFIFMKTSVFFIVQTFENPVVMEKQTFQKPVITTGF